LLVGGLGGGSGKTIVSLGLIRFLKNKGLKVRPFKKGPDYIDAAWLSIAAKNACCNLDPFFLDKETIISLFAYKSKNHDLAIIEGNRGIFDGLDVNGSCSTTYLAKILDVPVILVVDCTKVTRTVAALILGCNSLERDFKVQGVIFNRVAGPRHRCILTASVEKYTDVKVIGAIPKLKNDPIPERYMGLISHREYECEENIEFLSTIVSENIDIEQALSLAQNTNKIFVTKKIYPEEKIVQGINIGVVKDSSLWFYYDENLELLQRLGANIVEFSLIEDPLPPCELHGLYLGGGFPETQVQGLSKNESMRRYVFDMAHKGMPIFAECGGLMYLCKELKVKGQIYPLAGVFPYTVEIHKRPQGHGYTEVVVERDNPYFKRGTSFLGHEFHYSKCVGDVKNLSCLKVIRGTALGAGCDGLLYKNTFASYNHIHALHIPSWGMNFVKAAEIFKNFLDNWKSNTGSCKTITAQY